MSKSRTKKASLNIITSTILQIVTMISGLVLPRFFLSYFGSTYYGIIASASQFLGIVSVLTLGITASTRVALYSTITSNDIEGTSSIICATEHYMHKIAIVLGAYIVVIALLYPVIVHTGYSYFDVSLLIIIVGVSSLFEYYFGITYQTFLLADQSIYISNLFSSVAVILNAIVSIVLIVLGFNIQAVKAGSAMVFILRPVLQHMYITKKYHLIKKSRPDMSALEKRGDAMMHTLANIVHDNTDIIVLTLFTNVKVVSVYSVYNLVMCSLKRVQDIFTTGTEPIFGSMWANGETEKIEKNLNVFEYFVNVFNTVAFGTAMVMILPFISVYIPQNVTDINYFLPTYAIVISLAFATQGMRVPYLALVQGIGHYRQTKKVAITEAIINIVLSVVLVNYIGIVGVAVGTLVANLYRTFLYAAYIDDNIVCRGIGVVLCKFMWTMCCMVIIVIPGFFVTQNIDIDGWITWIVVASGVLVYSLFVVLLGSIIFYRNDLKYAIHLANTMIHNKT